MSTPSLVGRITIKAAAEYLAVSTQTVRKMIARGEIRAERLGPRLIRVDAASLDRAGRSLQYTGGDAA